jgi:hypothetical protein
MSWHEQKESSLRGEYNYEYSHGNANDVVTLDGVMSGWPNARSDKVDADAYDVRTTLSNLPATSTQNSWRNGYYAPDVHSVARELAPIQPNLAERQESRLLDILRGAEAMKRLPEHDLPESHARVGPAPVALDAGVAKGSLYRVYDERPQSGRPAKPQSEFLGGGGLGTLGWGIVLGLGGAIVLYLWLRHGKGNAAQSVRETGRQLHQRFAPEGISTDL